MGLSSILYHYITMGKNLDRDAQNELKEELLDMEKTFNSLKSDVRTLKRGIEPLEKELEERNKEYYSFKKELFKCFDLGTDGTTVTVNEDKILKKFGEEAYNYLCDF